MEISGKLLHLVAASIEISAGTSLSTSQTLLVLTKCISCLSFFNCGHMLYGNYLKSRLKGVHLKRICVCFWQMPMATAERGPL